VVVLRNMHISLLNFNSYNVLFLPFGNSRQTQRSIHFLGLHDFTMFANTMIDDLVRTGACVYKLITSRARSQEISSNNVSLQKWPNELWRNLISECLVSRYSRQRQPNFVSHG
jgi:hypothetical protein